MKNIQIIDGADNCTYDIYCISDDDFSIVFPASGQDIEFIEDIELRLTADELKNLMKSMFIRRIPKLEVNGIHGTLLFGVLYKKQYYPTKKSNEMIVAL